MDFFETIERRRSIRRYDGSPVPEEVMRRALSAAVLAPNSSNAQVWDFYWIRSEALRKGVVHACLSQSAARTAAELMVCVASPKKWRRSWPELKQYVREIDAPKIVRTYYEKFFPVIYSWGFLNSFALVKWIGASVVGIFRPMVRGPFFRRAVQEVAVKSAALACENFVLAVTAQGYSTCMMEGFDERRIKRLLKLAWSDRVVMVVAVGKETQRGTWGPRFRLAEEKVIHEV